MSRKPDNAAALEAAHTRRWRLAQAKARRTDAWTERLCRALSMREAKRWKLVSFRGDDGGESRGVVDILAVRRNTAAVVHDILRPYDLFEIILIQAKGGSAAAPSAYDVARLRLVAERYNAKAIVFYRWRKGRESTFKALGPTGWEKASAKNLFT